MKPTNVSLFSEKMKLM